VEEEPEFEEEEPEFEVPRRRIRIRLPRFPRQEPKGETFCEGNECIR
jgi:hypothetical protein